MDKLPVARSGAVKQGVPSSQAGRGANGSGGAVWLQPASHLNVRMGPRSEHPAMLDYGAKAPNPAYINLPTFTGSAPYRSRLNIKLKPVLSSVPVPRTK